MCELMAICDNMDVNPKFSFKEIKIRGGKTGIHSDGWGIGFYIGTQAVVYKEPKPAYSSKLAKEIEEGKKQLISKIFICHIRKATSANKLENTHPFERNLFNRSWLFAHNGSKGLDEYYTKHKNPNDYFKPIGDTGSEKGFVLILNSLKEKNATKITDQIRIIKEIADDIKDSGADFNFIMSNSEYLFCYYSGYNKLYYVTRSYRDKILTLRDADFKINVSDMKREGEKAVIVATNPLTKEEKWNKFEDGELKLFNNGELFYE
jgi:predicted glutamine amidotransferase